MSSSKIKRIISTAFASFPKAKNVKFVRCNKNNVMEVVQDRMLNGDDTANLAGGGSLYLLEVSYDLVHGGGLQSL
jgi:hypothetical protein